MRGLHVIVAVEGFKEGIEEYLNLLRGAPFFKHIREVKILDTVVEKADRERLNPYLKAALKSRGYDVHIFTIAEKDDLTDGKGRELI